MRTPRRSQTRLFKAGALAAALLLLAACSSAVGLDGPASTTETAGVQARRIVDLMVPVFWMALGVFVVVEGILLYTVLRFRRRPNSGIPSQVHGNTQIEIAWTIAPALIAVVIAVLTFRAQAENAVLPQNALHITAVGHQWWFEFQYPTQGAEGKPLVTATDMYIPVGQPVIVTLKGADVIHNFWVPKLAGKTYMIPGKTNYMTMTAEEPGVYRAVCSEFCGEAHALMRFRVIALPRDQYDTWLAQAKVPPQASTSTTVQVNGLTGDAARGQALFYDPKKQCVGCHAIDGSDARGLLGPNLTYYGSRTTIAAGLLDNTPENLARWLHNPSAIKPGNLMGRVITPQWVQQNLTEQDIADLVAYLHSMKVSVDLPVASN
jgi:cytochrome c oxidase subunit 2